MSAVLIRLVTLSFLFTVSSVAEIQLNGQGLSGNYKLSYLGTDLGAYHHGKKDEAKQVESFEYKEVATPPALSPIYLIHDPKGPSATVMGAGSNSPRLCEGEAELLSQELECAPLLKETLVDETSQCKMKKALIETLTWNIKDNLRYARLELISFDKDSSEKCQVYKETIREQLKKDSAPEFFKAMKSAELITEKHFPDVFLLQHTYQANLTDEKAIELPEGNQTGAYQLQYSHKSRTRSWSGTTKDDFLESSDFDATTKAFRLGSLGTLLFFHDSEKGTVRVAGAGLNKFRNCEKNSESTESSKQVFSCTFFKAKEEEVGTGCLIEHWIKEDITLVSGMPPVYEKIEQRHLVESTREGGCDSYREKIGTEIKEGTAEIFFKTLFESGGITNTDKLGDTFQLIHEYQMTPDN